MANSLVLRDNMIKLLDAKYRFSSVTADLEANNDLVRGFDDAGSIQVLNMTLNGLGDYDRSTGFPTGDITTTWESHTISEDRGMQFKIDSMDNEESASMVFVNLAKEFMGLHVVPEVDAYRFAKMFSLAGNTVQADLTKDTFLQAIDTGLETMSDDEVSLEGVVCYVSNEGHTFLKQSNLISRDASVQSNNGTISRVVERLDNGIEVRKVPRPRFYTQITLNGAAPFGYTKTASTGRDLNFVLVSKPAVTAITRHAKTRIFTPDTNQSADAYQYDYRLYHDLLIPANKVNGVYAHYKTV